MTSGLQTLRLASEALTRTADRLGESLDAAARLILATPGKVVVTGMGKSGLVGRKISATLCSTGTPAVFLHPAEAIHGDLGVYSAGEATVLLSKSGTTAELVRLLPTLRRFRSPLIGIIGNPRSTLAKALDVVLDASVEREADPHGMVPTTSALVAMALGDALAVTLMDARQFTPEDFSVFHPGGQLGRSLALRVRDVMHMGESVAWVECGSALKDVVIAMTRCPLGAACVVDPSGTLAGLITDGDLRRVLQAHDDLRTLSAADVMTPRPVCIHPEARLQEALRLMEERTSQISVLPVIDAATGACLGLVRIHDIYQSRQDSRRGPEAPDEV